MFNLWSTHDRINGPPTTLLIFEAFGSLNFAYSDDGGISIVCILLKKLVGETLRTNSSASRDKTNNR